MRRKLVNEHAARAVHRLNGAVLFVDDRRIHIVFIVVPVPRIFPQRARKNNGRLNFHVSLFAVQFAPEIDKCVFQRHTVRQKEGEALALV